MDFILSPQKKTISKKTQARRFIACFLLMFCAVWLFNQWFNYYSAKCAPKNAAPAGQSFDVLRLDLGPDFYNSLPLANGYQWTVRGRVYPAGTMAARPPCVSEIEAPAIGNYLIRGLTGNQAEHLAAYAVRLNVGTPDLKQYIFSGLVQTGLDAEGFPRLFFDAASLLSEPGRLYGKFNHGQFNAKEMGVKNNVHGLHSKTF